MPVPSRPAVNRRKSLVGETIDVAAIGQPQPRARNHKRSLTGHYQVEGKDGEPEAWPLGDEKVWKDALAAEDETSVPSIVQSIVHNVTTVLARQPDNLVGDDFAAYSAVALSARDSLIRDWNLTTKVHTQASPKRIYYFSFEFLIGRSLDNALLNLSVKPEYEAAVNKLGFRMEDLIDSERDAGLGNGGLGRLAACYVDSFATLQLPGWGYSLFYDFGIFKQCLDKDGAQQEVPDPWLASGNNPWELPRPDVTYNIRFYGTVQQVKGVKGKGRWSGGQEVLAVAHDVPVPGHDTRSCSNIRLWSARPISGFDLVSFNAGDYLASVQAAGEAETITRVLYPNDNNESGKELRLKQQAFWVSASLADVLRRFKKLEKPWSVLSDYVAIQLNDTHPSIAIPELMRILVDEEDVPFDQAWSITIKVFAYTNHTVLPEALEKWSVPLFEKLLPRHLQIIYDINLDFLRAVSEVFPGDMARLSRMSLIEEGQPKQIRMANLAVIGSHKVNGVAELHSRLVQELLFPDFVEFFKRVGGEGGDHFTNVTNGITPRRWLDQCNPGLSKLITQTLKTRDWLKDLHLLKGLEEFSEDNEFLSAFKKVKEDNKRKLAHLIETELGLKVNPAAQFTVQIKRIHEYKRQQLNLFAIIHQYLEIKDMTAAEKKKVVPRVCIFAGKAAPGYWMAKQIIKLIVNASKTINNDPDVGDLLKLVFLPDYSVSLAEVIIPAADVSVQISCAGTEASGTSNMKLALNGALLLGTVDGANVEIIEEVGEEQCFTFGFLTPQVDEQRYNNKFQPTAISQRSPRLARVFSAIESNMFGEGYSPITEAVSVHGDNYLVANDFDSFLDAISLLDQTWLDQHDWNRRCLLTTAGMGKFNSDAAVMKYCEEVWNVEPIPISTDAKTF